MSAIVQSISKAAGRSTGTASRMPSVAPKKPNFFRLGGIVGFETLGYFRTGDILGFETLGYFRTGGVQTFTTTA